MLFFGFSLHTAKDPGPDKVEVYIITPEFEGHLDISLGLFPVNRFSQDCIGIKNNFFMEREKLFPKFSESLVKLPIKSIGDTFNVDEKVTTPVLIARAIRKNNPCSECKSKNNLRSECARSLARELKIYYGETEKKVESDTKDGVFQYIKDLVSFPLIQLPYISGINWNQFSNPFLECSREKKIYFMAFNRHSPKYPFQKDRLEIHIIAPDWEQSFEEWGKLQGILGHMEKVVAVLALKVAICMNEDKLLFDSIESKKIVMVDQVKGIDKRIPENVIRRAASESKRCNLCGIQGIPPGDCSVALASQLKTMITSSGISNQAIFESGSDVKPFLLDGRF